MKSNARLVVGIYRTNHHSVQWIRSNGHYYSQTCPCGHLHLEVTCIKRSHLRQRQSGIIRQVTS